MTSDTLDIRFLGGRMSALQKDFTHFKGEMQKDFANFKSEMRSEIQAFQEKIDHRFEVVDARLNNIEDGIGELLRRGNGKA